MSVVSLLDQFPLLATAPEGVKRLRELILELAVRGKLVPQEPSDEPASELLKRIQAEKAKLITEGKIKKDKPLPELGEEEKPFDLPNGWEWVRLGAVTTFGHTDKSGEIVDSTWVLDLEDIEKDTSVLLQKVRFVDRPAKSDKNRFQAGDVLYGKLRPYLNKVIVADEAGVCTTEILPVRGLGGLIFPRYLMHALKRPGFLAYVNAKSYGMKMPRLGTDDGRNALLPLPPLAEQHRIVAKVDELMTLCDRLEAQQADAASAHATLVKTLLDTLTQSPSAADFAASWQRIAQHFDTLFTTEASIDALKQTLLQLAVMGKLVPQDPSDEPASELLKRIDEGRRDLLGEGYPNQDEANAQLRKQEKQVVPNDLLELPAGWQWATLMQCSLLVVDCHNKTAPYSSLGIPLIRTTNIRNGKLNFKDPKYVDDAIYSRWSARCPPQPGDILITREAPMGEVCIIPEGMKVCMGQRMMLIRPIPDKFNTSFLLYSLQAPDLMDRVQDKPVGATVQHLRVGGVETLLVQIPPLAEQHRIVAKVDELMARCDQLAARLKAARELAAHYAAAATEAVLEAA